MIIKGPGKDAPGVPAAPGEPPALRSESPDGFETGRPAGLAPDPRVFGPRSLMADKVRATVHRRLFGAKAKATTIGRFVVLQRIGTGGMGTVYAAHDPQLDRRVAVKILHRRVDGGAEEAVVYRQRLVREAKAMAKLAHPNVINVFEVGEVEDDVFLAMEYVNGGTLEHWLRRRRRSWRDIVEVFVAAGTGLAAAHEAGMVHRDFKPGNVLMGSDDRPRVTDFGLARAMDPALLDQPSSSVEGERNAGRQEMRAPASDSAGSSDPPRCLPDEALAPRSILDARLTETGAFVGTPRYAPPEFYRGQVRDPRSDQFSFCVALHEAVFGAYPFAGVTEAARVESLRRGVLRSPRPASYAPARLRKILERGLAKETDHRFVSMNVLLSELRSVLTSARRRRLAAGMVLLVVAVTVAGWALRYGEVGTLPCANTQFALDDIWDAARRSEVQKAFVASGSEHGDRMFAATAKVLDAYRDGWLQLFLQNCQATEIRHELSAQLFDLRTQCLLRRRGELGALVDLLARGGDRSDLGHAVQAAHSLSPLDRCADDSALRQAYPAPTDPAVRARVEALRQQLDEADAYRKTGRYQEARTRGRDLLALALALRHPPLIAEAHFLVGDVELQLRNGKDAEGALRAAGDAAALARDDYLQARVLRNLVFAVGVLQERFAEAEEIGRQGKTAVIRAGDEPMLRAALYHTLGAALQTAGKLDLGREHLEEALAIRQKLGDHPEYADTLMNFGVNFHKRGDLAAAHAHFEKAMGVYRRALHEGHPRVAMASANIGIILLAKGKTEEARQAFERNLTIHTQLSGEKSAPVAFTLGNLALTHQEEGGHAEAERLLLRALSILEDLEPVPELRVANNLNTLGNTLFSQRRYDQARVYHRRALAIREAKLPGSPAVAQSLSNLGNTFFAAREYATALEHYQRALMLGERRGDPEDHRLGFPLINLGAASCRLGKFKEGLAFAERALRLWRTNYPADHPLLAWVLNEKGRCLLDSDAPRAARVPLQRALAIRIARRVEPVTLAETQFPLARALWSSPHKRSEALALATKAWDALRAKKESNPDAAEIQAWLAARR